VDRRRATTWVFSNLNFSLKEEQFLRRAKCGIYPGRGRDKKGAPFWGNSPLWFLQRIGRSSGDGHARSR
jgi:hypothetical protein